MHVERLQTPSRSGAFVPYETLLPWSQPHTEPGRQSASVTHEAWQIPYPGSSKKDEVTQ
jgi:hypothetical protein